MKRIGMILLACSLLFCMVPSAASAKQEYSVKKAKGTAEITTQSLNVRSGPGKEYDVLGVAKSGDEFTVDGVTSNDWYRIDYKGEEGYVFRD